MLENLMCIILTLHSKIYPIHGPKVLTIETVLDYIKEKAGVPITARSPSNVDRVRTSVQQSPKKSLGARAKSLGYQ